MFKIIIIQINKIHLVKRLKQANHSFSTGFDQYLVIQGMEFIHKSSLRFHGNLRPSTCLVDSRLQIKLSGFGMSEFKSNIMPVETVNYQGRCVEAQFQAKYIRDCHSLTGTCPFSAEMYWTAPELLRQVGLLSNGTPKADVYSFSIIMWELMYNSKTGPYPEVNLEPKGEAGILRSG